MSDAFLGLLKWPVRVPETGVPTPQLDALRVSSPTVAVLVIRNEQMDAFRNDARAQFEQQLVEQIRTSFPTRTAALGEAGTFAFVRRAILFGAERNVTTHGAVTVLVELMLRYGEHFELSPDQAWAQKILAHPTLPAHLKLDTVRDRFAEFAQGRVIVNVEDHQSTRES